MTFSSVIGRGGAGNKTSGTSVSFSPNATVAVGELFIVQGNADNIGTTSASGTTEHSVSDSVGNTYTKIDERRTSSGAAADGATVSVFITQVTTAITGTDTVTLTLSSAVTAKNVIAARVLMGTGGWAANAVDGSATASGTGPSLQHTGLSNIEHLFVACVATEGPNTDTYTEDTDYTNITNRGAATGVADTNIWSHIAQKIQTATTSPTWQGSISPNRDWAVILLEVHETSGASASIAQTLPSLTQSVSATSAVGSTSIVRNNTFEGGTATAAVTAANSGGASGNGFDSVVTGTGNTITFDSTVKMHGALSAKVTTTGTSNAYMEWASFNETTQLFGRAYFRMEAFPTGGLLKLVQLRNGVLQDAAIQIGNAGKLQIVDSAGTFIAGSTNALPTGAFVRIEFKVTFGVTTGTVEAKYWTTPDSSGAATETITGTSQNTGTGCTAVRYGHQATIATVTFYIDDLNVNNTAYPGPSQGGSSGCTIVQTLKPPTQAVSVTSSATVTLPKSNSFEGGTNGTTITSGNSGGASGDAFNSVTIGGGNTFTFDTTMFNHGLVSAKVFANGVSNAYGEWTTGTIHTLYGRMYVNADAVPTGAAMRIMQAMNSSTMAAAILLGTGGKLQIIDSTSTVVSTSSNPVPVGQWYRIEYRIVTSATVGEIEVRYWTSKDATSLPNETLLATNVNTLTQITAVRHGHMGTAAVATVHLDDIKNDQVTWLGPDIEGTGVTGVVWDRSAEIDAGGFHNALDVGDDALHSNQLVVAGVDVGGIMQSSNNGDLWINANDGLTSRSQIHMDSILFSDRIANKVYATASSDANNPGGNGIFLRSLDGGKTWTQRASVATWGVRAGGPNHPRNTGRHIAEDPSGRLLWATNDGVKLSTDDGQSWSDRALTTTVISGICIDPNNTNRVYVTSESGPAGFRYIDNAFTGTPAVSVAIIGTTCYDVIAVDEGAASSTGTIDSLVFVQSTSELGTNSPTNPLNVILRNKGAHLSFVEDWSTVEPSNGTFDWSRLQKAWDIAKAEGKKLHYRVRAGDGTPSFHAGRTWMPTGGDLAAGLTLPCPFNTDGTPNTTFINAAKAMFQNCLNYCTTNNITLEILHLTTFDAKGAEPHETDELIGLTGGSLANSRNAHFALIDAYTTLTPTSQAIELPRSGIFATGSTLGQDMMTHMAAAGSRWWSQRNALRDCSTGWSEAVTKHGHQLIWSQPRAGSPSCYGDSEWVWGTPADSRQGVYDYTIQANDAFVEIHYGCWSSNANRNILIADAAAHASSGGTAVYVAAGTLGVRKWTETGGLTNPTPGGMNLSSVWCDIDARNFAGNTVIAVACANPVSGQCVWRSLNGGTSWAEVSTVSGSHISNSINGIAQPWWYAVSEPGLRLGDSGNGWDTGAIRLNPNNIDDCFIAGRGGVWRSQNFTQTTPIWHPCVNGDGAFSGFDIAISPVNEAHIIASAVDWTAVASTTRFDTQPVELSPQSYRGHTIVIDSAESAFLFMGARDTNDGVVYSTANPFAASPTFTNENWVSGGAVGRALGGAKGTNASATRVLVALEEDAGIRQKVGTGGWTLVQVIAGASLNPKKVCFVWKPGSANIFMLHPIAGLYRSTNYGGSWTNLWTTQSNVQYAGTLIQDPNNEGTLYASTGTAVYKFTNTITSNGSPVNVTPAGVTQPGILAARNDAGVTEIYMNQRVGGSGGVKLFKTRDGATTWTEVTTPEFEVIALWVHAMAVAPNGDVWIETDGDSVYRGIMQQTQGVNRVSITQTLPRVTQSVPNVGRTGTVVSIAQTMTHLGQAVTLTSLSQNVTASIAQTLPKVSHLNAFSGFQSGGGGTPQAVPTYVVTTRNLDGSSTFDCPHRNLEISYVLNGPGVATWTMPVQDTGVTRANFEPWKREVVITREGVTVWGGYINAVSASTGAGEGEEVRIGAVGWFGKLHRRVIDVKKKYVNTEQFDIMWDLINYTQGKTNGDFGVTRGTVPASGYKRDATFQWWERQVIGEVIENYSAMNHGFDFEITPTKVWKVYYPQKGSQISQTFTLGQNVVGFNQQIDGENIASEVHAIGDGQKDRTCIAVVFDSTAQTGYKRLEAVVDFPEIRHFTTLQDKAQRELNLNKQARDQPQLSVETNDPPWGSYNVGDTARVVANYGFFNVNAFHRIVAIVVHLTYAGSESITVHFDEVTAV